MRSCRKSNKQNTNGMEDESGEREQQDGGGGRTCSGQRNAHPRWLSNDLGTRIDFGSCSRAKNYFEWICSAIKKCTSSGH